MKTKKNETRKKLKKKNETKKNETKTKINIFCYFDVNLFQFYIH